MLRFPCRCGHQFEEPIEAAGGCVQCPECRLLNDIPALGQFQEMAQDGTYNIKPEDAPPKKDSAGELLVGFTGQTVDADGNPIDLRNTAQDMSQVGEVETADQSQRRQRPRYDPETGELLQPIPLAQPQGETVRPPEIPFARPAVAYAQGQALYPQTGRVLMELVRPHSVVVMFFVLVICLLAGLTGAEVISGLIFFAPVFLAMFIAVIAHYGNVVNEIGVEEKDELPRVLGNMSLFEDIWLPSAAFGTALILSYGPAIALVFLAPGPLGVAIALTAAAALLGTCVFPAITLTLLTSGSIANLRPDRVARVIGKSPKRYLGMAGACFLASACSAWGLVGMMIELERMGLTTIPVPSWATGLVLDMAMTVTGIFMMHYFCWQMGLYYRVNNARFGWVGRVHDSQPRPPVVRRKPRYVVPPKAE